jgi:DNA-binding transcriptional LysR family regulator
VVTFASRAYLRKPGTPKTPDDLEHHAIIGVRTSPGVYLSRFRFQQEGRMVSRDFATRIVVDLGDGPAVAAMAGVGIGQSYNYAVAHHVEEGKLVPILHEWAWTGPPIGAVHLPNRFLSPKVQVFLDFVKESLGGKVSPYRADWDNR